MRGQRPDGRRSSSDPILYKLPFPKGSMFAIGNLFISGCLHSYLPTKLIIVLLAWVGFGFPSSQIHGGRPLLRWLVKGCANGDHRKTPGLRDNSSSSSSALRCVTEQSSQRAGPLYCSQTNLYHSTSFTKALSLYGCNRRMTISAA